MGERRFRSCGWEQEQLWGCFQHAVKQLWSVQTGWGPYPALCSVVTETREYVDRGFETDHSSPSCAKDKNVWSYTSNILYAFMTCIEITLSIVRGRRGSVTTGMRSGARISVCVCVCMRVSVLRTWTAVTNKLDLFEMACGSRHFPKPAGSISRIETALLSISSGVELRTQYEYVPVNRPKRYLSAFFFCCGIFHMFSLRVKNHTVRTPNKSLKMCHCLSPSVRHLQLGCFTWPRNPLFFKGSDF